MVDPLAGLPDEVRKQYEVLRQAFRYELAQRWAEISECQDDQATCEGLHRLCGVAGGFGFDDIQRLARLAETTLISGMRHDHHLAMKDLQTEMFKWALP